MSNIKLSQITSGGAFVAATDNIVTVRNGNTDVLTTITNPSANVNSVSGDGTYITNSSSTGAVTLTTAFGTAALSNIGTSGANVPLLNGANTWSTAQTFTPASSSAKASIVIGAASQSANIQEWQKNNGTAYVYVGPDTLPGNSETANFLNVTGTLPTVPTATTNGINFTITGAGSSSQVIRGFKMLLAAGYTGNQQTRGAFFENDTAGTDTTFSGGNSGFTGYTHATTSGHNYGANLVADGSSSRNAGALGLANSSANAAALNVGLMGMALNATVNVGGFFALLNANPTLGTSCALICDNGAQSADIFEARANGTIKVKIGSTGILNLAAVGTSSGDAVSIDGTQTLTNKRITKRVVTASDATSVTPNTDNADITYQANTQTAGTLTINADGGTPTNGQSWLFKIKSTNAQTFSWNAVYVGGTVALPTATTGSGKIDYYSFIYDTVNSKWQFTSNALGF